MKYDHYKNICEHFTVINHRITLLIPIDKCDQWLENCRIKYLNDIDVNKLVLYRTNGNDWRIRMNCTSKNSKNLHLFYNISTKELATEILEYIKNTEILFI